MTSRVIGISGAGTMGCGIAAVLRPMASRLVVFEPEAQARASALERIAAARDTDTARPSPIEVVGEVEGLTGCGLVIEAITESLEAKHALYARLFDLLGPETIIASNTSSLLPDRLAMPLSDDQASRFLVAHFWNPPWFLPLVEVVPGTRTRPSTTEAVRALLCDAGLKPVQIDRPLPGFIGNRLQFAMLREALALIEAQVATPEMIDEVVRYSLGRRYAVTGPIASADLGGLHVMLAVAHDLWPDLAGGDEGTAVLQALVDADRLGARSGRGFYDWTDTRSAAVVQRQEAMLK